MFQGEKLKELGKLLQYRRESLGISRQELAEQVGSRYDIIRLYEKGERAMRLDRLFSILEALDLSLTEEFVLCSTKDIQVDPKAYQMALRLSAMNREKSQRLMYRIQAMLTMAEDNERQNK